MIKVYVVYRHNHTYYLDPYEEKPVIVFAVYRDKDDAVRNAKQQKGYWIETQLL